MYMYTKSLCDLIITYTLILQKVEYMAALGLVPPAVLEGMHDSYYTCDCI